MHAVTRSYHKLSNAEPQSEVEDGEVAHAEPRSDEAGGEVARPARNLKNRPHHPEGEVQAAFRTLREEVAEYSLNPTFTEKAKERCPV